MSSPTASSTIAPLFHIFVNTRPRTANGPRLSFEQAVGLSGLPANENTVFTVTYYAPTANVKGSLTDGQSVDLVEGMVFNVTATDKS